MDFALIGGRQFTLRQGASYNFSRGQHYCLHGRRWHGHSSAKWQPDSTTRFYSFRFTED
jgi:hypothetical protein